MSLCIRTNIIADIQALQTKTGITIRQLLQYAGISLSTWYDWIKRADVETNHNSNIPRMHWLTPAETQAIISFCTEHQDLLVGYRYLTWLMIDQNIVFASPSTVYNVMKKNDMIRKWAQPIPEEKRKGFVQPLGINEQWHTDISYVKVSHVFYYFISLLDGFSRKILVWNLCDSMEGLHTELLVLQAKELYPEAHARIIHDNGKQYVSKDFIELIGMLELYETATSPAHPQSNGKLERFHRTFKTEHVRTTAYCSYEDAVNKIKKWVLFYNQERLHSAVHYLTPNEVFDGQMEKRVAERKEKLHTALNDRQKYWSLTIP